MENDNFISGDIGLCTSEALISRIIRFFTSIHTGSATKSHVFGFVDSHLIVEALGKIRVNPISNYQNVAFDVYRIPLNKEDQDNYALNMLREINKGYGWFKLPLFALDGAATAISRVFGRKDPVFFFTKKLGITNFRVCSQYIVWGIHKFTSYKFKDHNNKEVSWRVVSPDLLEDLLKLPINGAIKTHEHKLQES